jgi:cytidylate kinase
MQRVVTIDGPAGSGKSTVARAVAGRLGWRFLDTGAMYRAVTLAAMRRGLEPAREGEALESLARGLAVELLPTGEVWMDGEDVSEAIRTREVARAIGPVADHAGVRSVLVGWQRAFAEAEPTVTEGRDQGTIVFPDAVCKLFLTATIEARVRRRMGDLKLDPEDAGAYGSLWTEIERRDREDADRAIAPLVPAPGAVVLDTTELTPDAVVERILGLVGESLSQKGFGEGDPGPFGTDAEAEGRLP